MSGYPPGVTGNEWQIAGYPPCGACGHLSEDHWVSESGDDPPARGECFDCSDVGRECGEYTPYPVEP